MAQGREKTKQFLLDNPDIMAELEKKIRENADAVQQLGLGSDDEDEAGGNDIPLPDDPADVPEEKPSKSAKSSSAKKKSVVVDVEDDFDEFAIEDMDS